MLNKGIRFEVGEGFSEDNHPREPLLLSGKQNFLHKKH